MNVLNIPFEKSGLFTGLIGEYLSDASSLSEFYLFPPAQSSVMAVCQERKSYPINRELLHQVISEQYSGFNVSASTGKNIDLLKSSDTFTITTGHQLNILGGPLYVLSKILSVIKLADQWKIAFPYYNFVPVFWLASEDHDIEEIRKVNVSGKQITWNTEQTGPTGRLSPKDLPNIISDLAVSPAIKRVFEEAYLHENISKASRHIANSLFGDLGLVIIDPDDSRLKKSFSEIMERDAFSQINYALVDGTVESLAKLDFNAPVNPRQINLFFLENGFRARIEKYEERFVVVDSDKSFSEKEISDLLKNSPELFSPNVVLRPLYQEFILPNIAYVGGPSEISYWLEFRAMFEANDVSFPMLIERDHFLFLPKFYESKINTLGIEVEDLLLNEDSLLEKALSSKKPSVEHEFALIQKALDSLSEKALAIDSTLQASVEGRRQKIYRQIDSLESKMFRALKKKNEISVSQIKKLREVIFPGGSLQERVENFSGFATDLNFVKEVYDKTDPLAKTIKVFFY